MPIPVQLRYSTTLGATPTTAEAPSTGPLQIGETAWIVATGGTKIWVGDNSAAPHNRLLLSTDSGDATGTTAWYLKGVGGELTGPITTTQTTFTGTALVTADWVHQEIAAGQPFAGTWDPANNNPNVLTATKVNGTFWTVDPAGSITVTLPGITANQAFAEGDTLTWNDQPAPNGTFRRTSASGMTQPEGDARYVRLAAASTMTADLTMAATTAIRMTAPYNPVGQEVATAASVGTQLGNYLALTGGVVRGVLYLNHNPTTASLLTMPTLLRTIGDNGEDTHITIEAYGGNPVLSFRRANGDASGTPTPLTDPAQNDNLGAINFQSGAGNLAGVFWARMRAQATEAWSATNHGCHLTFDVTANGASQPILLSVLDITSDGIAVTGRATLTQGPRTTGGDNDAVRKQDVDAAITRISGGTF